MRKIQLVNGEFYHIYNRGVDKRQIFLDKEDYHKFYSNLRDCNNNLDYIARKRYKDDESLFDEQDHIVQIIAYSLLPNHFHLLLKQLKDKGIENFMRKVCTSYAVYFNVKYDRSGSLFQGRYKSIHISDDRYLTWLSAYINGNIEIHKLGKAISYKWSSLPYFLGKKESDIVEGTEMVLSQFDGNIDDYQKFLEVVIEKSKEIKETKRKCEFEKRG